MVQDKQTSEATNTTSARGGMQRPPVVLLREQALRWEQETGKVLRGVVTSEQGSYGSLIHSLFIEAPALDDYRYRIVSVSHQVVPLYPADVIYNVTEGYDIETRGVRNSSFTEMLDHQAPDAAHLEKILRRIFESSEMKEILASLVAQSEMPVAA